MQNMANSTVMLKQRAHRDILELIMSGQFAPGDILNRRGLAQRLKMSSAPVHEAMIHLERDGFLQALPRRGTRVRSVSLKDVRGHLIIREALECQAARMICGGRVRQALPKMEALASEADSVGQADNVHASHEVSFHVALVELADCPALLCEYKRVMQIGLFYSINLLMGMSYREPLNHHLSLLQELCTDSPDEAEAFVRQHIWSGKPDSLKMQEIKQLTEVISKL